VIDASLNPRIAHDLRERGRHAYSLAQLNLRHAKDPVMIPELYARYPTCVLVTGDDKMPGEHREVIELAGATVATITGQRPEPYTESQEAGAGGSHAGEIWRRGSSAVGARATAQLTGARLRWLAAVIGDEFNAVQQPIRGDTPRSWN
jgi:hypothetical protein